MTRTWESTDITWYDMIDQSTIWYEIRHDWRNSRVSYQKEGYLNTPLARIHRLLDISYWKASKEQKKWERDSARQRQRRRWRRRQRHNRKETETEKVIGRMRKEWNKEGWILHNQNLKHKSWRLKDRTRKRENMSEKFRSDVIDRHNNLKSYFLPSSPTNILENEFSFNARSY